MTGDAAWSVDPSSAESISAAMLNVLQHSDEREQKIQHGLARAKQYTWQACAEQTLEVYRKVLASKG